MSHKLNDTTAEGYKIFLQSNDATILQDDGSTAFFFLNKVLSPPTPNLNMMIGVIDCEIPVSYYNINDNNNQITINSHTITLINQNYTAFNIQDEINKQLLINNISVIVAFSQQSNKFTFSKNADGVQVIINSGNLCPFLGLVPTQLGQQVDEITTENCCNLAGTSNIYVSSNFTINNLNSSGQYSGILCKVHTDASSGSYIFYQPAEIQYHVVGNNNVNNIIITLRDDNLKTINLNGLKFSLTLSVQFSYKRKIQDFDEYLLHTTEKSNISYNEKTLENEKNTNLK